MLGASKPVSHMSRTIASLSGSSAILGPLGEQLPARLAADVLLPFFRIRGRTGHDDLDDAALVVVAMPFWAQLDDLVVERDANPAAHADDHGLAVQADGAVLEVLHEVLGDHGEALLGADDSLNVRPFALELLLLALGFVFGQLGNLVVELRLLVLVQLDTGDTALVIDRNRRAVLDAPVDVVNINVLAEHGGRVHVFLLDRRPCEADEGGVGQGIAKVLGEAIGDFAGLALHLGSKAVLAAMRLVGNHDNVAAVGQDRIVGLAALGRELLNGREHHAAGGAGQSLLQILPAVGLPRGVTDQVTAHGEGAE